MKIPTYVDRDGNLYDRAAAQAYVCQRTGASNRCIDYLLIGEVYENGGVWLQRIA